MMRSVEGILDEYEFNMREMCKANIHILEFDEARELLDIFIEQLKENGHLDEEEEC